MAKAKPLCPRCGTPVTGGNINCPEIMFQGSPIPDPSGVTITLRPCGCTANRADPDFDQFLDVVRQVFGVP